MAPPQDPATTVPLAPAGRPPAPALPRLPGVLDRAAGWVARRAAARLPAAGTGPLSILAAYARPHRKAVLLTLALGAAGQAMALADPLLLGHVLDRYAMNPTAHAPGAFLRDVALLLGLAAVAAALSRGVNAYQGFAVARISKRIGRRLYNDGVAHVLGVPFARFEEQRSGATLQKLQRARMDLERFATGVISILYAAIVGVAFGLAYAVYVHWSLAAAIVVTVPAVGWLTSVLSRRIRTVYGEIAARSAALAGSTTESLRNVELVKSMGLEAQEVARLNGATDRILALEEERERRVRTLNFVQGTVVNLQRTVVFLLMVWLIYTETITLGAFFALLMYSFFIFAPLQEMGRLGGVYREAQASLAAYREIMSVAPAARPRRPVEVERLDRLAFENVGFRHRTASDDALRGVSFQVRRGETVAFVGPSGAGKTTLVKLLIGLYPPGSGRVLYDGHDSTVVDMDALRRRLGMVTQETQLFAGTIRDNLRFVCPDADDAACLKSLRDAACTTLLERAPQGLDTPIGEGGMRLSGGERQRVSIARALLRHPYLLVFDEATSALDSLTEREITATIRQIAASREAITILVAHRLSTVMHADRIHVLERGEIVESGDHDALVAQRGLYYAMWRQQVGERRPGHDDAAALRPQPA